MRSVLSKGMIPVYAQMLIIVVAFALMAVSSFIFVSGIELRFLLKEAEHELASKESQITAELLETESYLSGFAETVRYMILDGGSAEKTALYIEKISNFTREDKVHLAGFLGAYVFFDADKKMYFAGRGWMTHEEFAPEEFPWYKAAAAAANGGAAITGPYTDIITGNRVVTFSRLMLDDEGRPLGVICLDTDVTSILDYAVNSKLAPGSYCVLVNEELITIAHPERDLINMELRQYSVDFGAVADDLKAGVGVSERRVKNYRDDNTIIFFRKIIFGWHIGVIIPVGQYYKNVNNTAVFLVMLGVALTAVLCVIFYRLAAAKKKSDLITRQKNNFLATMSHEIRTPLNSILGVAGIQLQNADLPLDIKDAFTKIFNSGDLLLGIVNDILDLSKIEGGKLELTPVKYEVANLIASVVQLNLIRYESKSVAFKLQVDENVPSVLVGDGLRIKQILSNLISNAFKYTESGEITLSVSAEISACGGAVHVILVFQISDTGQGMTQEEVDKLFNEDARFNLEANRSTEGAGLGMSITRNLVQLMYGDISVKSEQGKGTAVTVRLPQKNEGLGVSGMIGKELAEKLRQFQFDSKLQNKKAQITYEPMPYGRVLIVDDVETNIFVAKGLMAPYGLKIDIATSGYAAIDKITEGNAYDVIFMDHMMPKMDGIETTKNIRNLGYARPIVALTANAMTGQADRFLHNGFDGFISKPIDIRELNDSLNKFIRDKQPAEVIEKARLERTELMKLTAGKTRLSAGSELAKIFTRDAEKAAAVLETADCRKSGDLQMFIINVHSMKSALANIGETDLSAVAFKLEQSGRAGDIGAVTAGTPLFLEALRAVIEKIKPIDEEGETVIESAEDQAYLREKMQVIREACGYYDKKTVKYALAGLKEKTWSPRTNELLDNLSELVLHSEFDEAAALAGRYYT
jgi:signal transduction histidine kinase/CheY-like chemotaxis protein/HPt (histidine-containing phosphotransfer) domain-containing protein